MRLSPRRIVLLSAIALTMAGAFRLGLPLWRTREANLRELKIALPQEPLPSRRSRLLILVPHCDDETLACGGLIAQSLKAGASVQVVLVTNGDGFRWSAQRLFNELKVPPKDFLALADSRRAESLAALSSLGLPAERVIFLGYPDGGTAKMWLNYWEAGDPYTSPQTRKNHNPYPNSLRPGAPYCGRALLDDLKEIILNFKPTTILCPHPNDNHADHWALYCYTLAALYELRALDKTRLWLYLVHRGDWPLPQGLHPTDPMAPPAALANLDTRWQSLPFDPALVKRKEEAILRYRSQILVMKRFLLSFARKSELFGERPLTSLPVVEEGRIKVEGKREDWEGIRPAILDPARDLATSALIPGADFVRVYAARDRNHLFLRLDLSGKASREVEYQIYLHPISETEVGPPQTYAFRLRGRIKEGELRAAGRFIEISLPWPGERETNGIMLGAVSRLGRRTLDKTAWTLLRG